MTLQNIKSYASPKNIFLAIAGIQLVIMLLYSFGAGVSADEFRHYKQARKVYNFFSTKGEDKSALENTGIDPMQYNGQSFDNVLYVIQKWFKVDNYMELRHFFNALTGWLVIFIAGLVLKEILGFRAAIFVLLALFLSPRYFGHALNNNKDIPFALGFILTIYGTLIFLKQLPKPKWNAYLWTTLGIGLSISIRMAGILNIFFVAFSLGVYYLLNQPVKDFTKPQNIKILYRIVISLAAITIVGFIIGVVFWPFVIADPVNNVGEIFEALSKHPVSLNQTFQGKVFSSSNIPWYYTITYIAITYPLYVLAGLLASLFTLFSFRKHVPVVYIITILFPWFFVVFWMSYKNSNVYGAIRHITFIYPLAVIASVLFFALLFRKISENKNKIFSYVLIGAIALLSWHSVLHMIKNPRYSYVYFNEMVGGLKNAYGKYETDYFYHSIREASLYIKKQAKSDKSMSGRKIIVATNHLDPTRYYFRNDTNFSLKYVRYYQRGEHNWDYAIFVNSYIEPYQLKKEIYPPSNTIHTIDVNDKPICAILKRKNKLDLQAYEFMKQGNYPAAISDLRKVLKDDPKYEWACLKLMECYYNTRNFQQVIKVGEQCIKAYGNKDEVLSMIGLSYLNTNQVEYGIMTFKRILNENERNASAYFYLGIAYSMKQDVNSALKNLLNSIEINPNNPQAYKFVADIYQQQNNMQMAQKYYQIYNSMVKQ